MLREPLQTRRLPFSYQWAIVSDVGAGGGMGAVLVGAAIHSGDVRFKGRR